MTFLTTRRRRFQAIFPIVQTAEHTAGCLLHSGTKAQAQEQYARTRQAVPLKLRSLSAGQKRQGPGQNEEQGRGETQGMLVPRRE